MYLPCNSIFLFYKTHTQIDYDSTRLGEETNTDDEDLFPVQILD